VPTPAKPSIPEITAGFPFFRAHVNMLTLKGSKADPKNNGKNVSLGHKLQRNIAVYAPIPRPGI
jgi:hypothetical protein